MAIASTVISLHPAPVTYLLLPSYLSSYHYLSICFSFSLFVHLCVEASRWDDAVPAVAKRATKTFIKRRNLTLCVYGKQAPEACSTSEASSSSYSNAADRFVPPELMYVPSVNPFVKRRTAVNLGPQWGGNPFTGQYEHHQCNYNLRNPPHTHSCLGYFPSLCGL